MPARKVDYDDLMRLVKEKVSQVDIARKMNVNPSTITRAIQKLKASASKVVVLEKGKEWGDMNFRLWEEFMKGFSSVNKFQDALEKYVYKGDQTVFAELQRKIESKWVEQGEGVQGKREHKNKGGNERKSRIEQRIERNVGTDPRALLAKVQQIREEHVMDSLELLKQIMDVEKILSFLNDMVAVILRREPSARQDIQETLKRHKLIRSIVTFDTGASGDLRD